MSKIVQYSRISHHTIGGTASSGLTFSTPLSEDFTDGSWTNFDLALSEIGVNEQDKRVYIRIDDEIKELQLAGSTFSGDTLAQVLSNGNTTDGENIIMNASSVLLSGSGETLTLFSDTNIYSIKQSSPGGPLQSVDIGTSDSVSILSTDSSNYSSEIKVATNSVYLKSLDIPTNDFYTLKVEKDGIKHTSDVMNEPVVYSLGFIGTANATPDITNTIDVSGFSGSVITVDGIVTAQGTLTGKGYGAKLFATFKYYGGTLSQISTTDKAEKTDFATATSNITTSGTNIIVQVTGEAATNINWWTRINYLIIN
jgi:hypothetical protein